MKIITLFCLLFSFKALGFEANYSQGLTHEIERTRLSRGGKLKIQYKDINSDTIKLKISYKFKYRILFSKRSLSGDATQEIPSRFKQEQAYIDLERDRVYQRDSVRLIHKGRTNWKNHYDCHVIELIPLRDDDWQGEITYCPDLPELGFASVKLTAKDIPVIGSYSLRSHYQD